jgi:hypothetical protein
MAIALVQNSITGSFSNPATITFPNPSTPGNFYAVWIANTEASSITDNASPSSNTYTLVAHDATMNISLYYAENIAVPVSGPTTISANGVGGGLNFIACVEFSGVASVGALDQQADGDGTGIAISSGNVTPSANGELIYAIMKTSGGSPLTPGSGFTIANSNPSNGLWDEYQVLTGGAGTPIAGTASLNSSATWAIIAATFEPAATGAPSSVIFDSMNS